MTDLVAEFSGVSKCFGNVQVLRDLSLSVRAGEAVAFLGPNGAGKSTAVNMMLGLLRPDAGSVHLFGRSPWDPIARRDIGATPQDTDFPPQLKVVELLRLVRAHYATPRSVDALLDEFELTEIANRFPTKLSGGQRRRVALALAFAGSPKAVFLDEPTTGLDVEARQVFWRVVRNYHQDGGTVFLTTHYLAEAEAIASRVVLIGQGQIVHQGSVADIRRRIGVRHLRFRAERRPSLPVFSEASFADGWLELMTADPDQVVRDMVQSGVAFSDLEIQPVSLERAVTALFSDRRAAANGDSGCAVGGADEC